jgi:hypothetical protein
MNSFRESEMRYFHSFCWFVVAGFVLALGGAVTRGDDPPPQVLSGKALNDLLKNLEGVGPPVEPEPPSKLPAKVRSAINILTPGGVDSAVFLKVPKAKWPSALEEAKQEKEQVIAKLSAAVKEARKGKVSAKTARELSEAVTKLRNALDAGVADIPPRDFIPAARFIGRLKEAAKSVDRANLGEELTLARTVAREGKTAPDLVRFMLAKKLKFAPALSDDAAGYGDLHKALTEYHRRAKKK